MQDLHIFLRMSLYMDLSKTGSEKQKVRMALRNYRGRPPGSSGGPSGSSGRPRCSDVFFFVGFVDLRVRRHGAISQKYSLDTLGGPGCSGRPSR